MQFNFNKEKISYIHFVLLYINSFSCGVVRVVLIQFSFFSFITNQIIEKFFS